jgi:hypothetical protein
MIKKKKMQKVHAFSIKLSGINTFGCMPARKARIASAPENFIRNLALHPRPVIKMDALLRKRGVPALFGRGRKRP